MEGKDLDKLSERELLILTAEKVQSIGKTVDKLDCQREDHEKRITVLETRGRLLGTLWGLIAGAISGILTNRL